MCSTSLTIKELEQINCSVKINEEWLKILSPSYLDITPVHWLQYEPPSCTTHSFLAVLYFLLFVPGFFGNILIIHSFLCKRAIRDSHTTFLFNLSIADLLMNLEIPPFIFNCLSCGPSFGVIGCKAHAFVGALSGTASLATICVISFERFFVIRYPFEMKTRMTSRRSLGVCLLIWIYSLTVSIPPLFGYFNRYIPEGYLTTCSFDYLNKEKDSRLFVLTMFFTSYIIPLIVIILSYLGIVLTMKQSARQFSGNKSSTKVLSLKVSSNKRSSSRDDFNWRSHQKTQNIEYNLMKSCICLITLWTCAWTPYAVVALIGLFTDGSLITPEVSMFPAIFAKVASLIDAYIYGLSHPGFRKEMKKKLTFLGVWSKKGPKSVDCITSARFRTFSRSDKFSFNINNNSVAV